MKRSLLLLACTLVVLGLAGGALWFMMDYNATPEEAVSASSSQVVTLYTKPEAALTRLEIENQEGSYTLLPQGDLYTLEGYEAQHMNQPKLQSCVDTFSTVSVTLVDSQPQDLAQFGLATPAATATVQFGDSSFTLLVGGQAPGSSGYYVAVPGDSAVYLMYGPDSLLKPALNFVTTILTTSPDPTGQTAVLPHAITLGGTVRPQPLVLGNRETTEMEKQMGISGMVLLSHGNRELNYDKGAQSLSSLLSVTTDRAITYKPTPEQLAEAGLTEPYSTADFRWTDGAGQEQSCVLRVSQPKEGLCYLVQEGNPVLYEISADKLSWLELQYADLASKLFLTPFIGDVSKVTVEAPGITETYTLDAVQLEDKEDYQATSSKGTVLDIQLFKDLYQCLIGIPAEEYTSQSPDPEAQVLLTITYHYRNGQPSDTVQLLAGPPLQAYISFNDKVEFLTKAKYADTILQNITLLEQGQALRPLY